MDEQLTMDQIVEQGQALIGSPETCSRLINQQAEIGVDEVLLFMQGARTPHDKVMDSIRLFSEEVMPRLKQLEAASTS